MEVENENFTPAKRTRKRKEEPPDSSDSENITRTTKTKRKHTVSSSSDEEQAQPGECKGLLDSTKELLKFLRKARDLSDLKLARKMAAQLCEIALEAETEKAALKQKLASSNTIDERISAMDTKLNSVVKTITELSKPSKHQPTYAEMLRTSAAANLETAKSQKKHIVTIFPKENSKIEDSDETKKVIISSMAPTKEKLKIVNVRKISNRGVLIETKTEKDLRSVMENEKLRAAGLTVGVPAKLRPRILIRGIPTPLQEKEITSAVRLQNLDSYPKENFHEHFKLMFKTGIKEKETTDWVAEVSPEVRKKIIKEGRIYIQWHACYVQDFLTVSRCYRCQSFGHISKYCKATIETCGHCGENGHSQKNCTAAKDHPRCINCKRAGKSCEHSSRSRECPAYQNALRMHASKIDYGQE